MIKIPTHHLMKELGNRGFDGQIEYEIPCKHKWETIVDTKEFKHFLCSACQLNRTWTGR